MSGQDWGERGVFATASSSGYRAGIWEENIGDGIGVHRINCTSLFLTRVASNF